MYFFRLLAVLAAFFSCTVQVTAETFQLYSQGDWTVSYQVNHVGRTSCVAEVSARDVYFSIDVTEEFGLTAWFISSNNNFGPNPQDGRVSIQIDNQTPWDTPASGKGDTVQMFSLNKGFLIEIMNGRKLLIDTDQDGWWEAWFSLYGSNAAIAALADCNTKL